MRRTPEEAAATRAALIDAAIDVFAERGYARATLADIASAAGVTRGAAYHHFGHKSSLYLAAVAERWNELAAPLWRILESDEPALERLRRFLLEFFTAVERDRSFHKLFVVLLYRTETLPELEPGLAAQQAAIRDWTGLVASLLREARADGQVAADTDPERAALGVVATANGVISTWLACPSLFSPAAEAASLADFVLAALTQSAGRRAGSPVHG
jgi:TetR/AcrR family transcriptional regulator, acrAB operon repressor